MAYNYKKIISVNFILLVHFLVFLLLTNSEIGEAALCKRASQTWSGMCTTTHNCDNQCKSWENADHGACHWGGGQRKCYCFFKC
ncbi:defensin-like protein 1 [Impatiens glandulifera]|uniref:defensin-like protein 1 n=1 Tax=Impatiens glandulifera TaxID=253017 RepID=UPI001FB168C3|nr:defensin-like protein 1 [Impatiens glandulifera]